MSKEGSCDAFFLALSHFVVFISTKAFHNGILFIFLWTSGQVAFVLSEIYQTQLEIELLFLVQLEDYLHSGDGM